MGQTPAWRGARLVVDAIGGFVGEFLWGSLRDGAIRLNGMSAAMATIVLASAGLLVLTTVSFAAGDLLRGGRDLLVIPNGVAGRGSLVPTGLAPVTLAIVAVGWALLLAGAMHAAPIVRIGALLVYAAMAVAFVGLATTLESTSGIRAWPAWIALLAVAAVFTARWRARPRPAAEFTLLLLLVAGTLAVSAAGLFRSDEITGRGFALQQLDILLELLVGLTIPLVLVAGMDTVGFGLDAASWLMRFLAGRLARLAMLVALGIVAAWRIWDVLGFTLSDLREGGTATTLLPVIGALGGVAAIGGYWFVIGRLARRVPGSRTGEDSIDHASARVRLPLGLAYAGIGFVLFPILLVLNALGNLGVADGGLVEAVVTLASFLGTDLAVTGYRVLVGLALVAIGAWLATRGHGTLAVFIGAIGVSDLLAQALARVDALRPLLWSGPHPLDVAWTAVFIGIGLVWLVSGTLTVVRAQRLTLLLLLSAMLSHFDIVADPLAPLLGFAGVGLVVFGLVWGFLTGGSWTNGTSVAFPRPSRVYLYLGYSLVSIAILNWSSVTHDLEALSRLQDTGANGVLLLGYPLVFALFTLVLAGARVDRPIDQPVGDSE
jgi:hypothetical protein